MSWHHVSRCRFSTLRCLSSFVALRIQYTVLHSHRWFHLIKLFEFIRSTRFSMLMSSKYSTEVKFLLCWKNSRCQPGKKNPSFRNSNQSITNQSYHTYRAPSFPQTLSRPAIFHSHITCITTTTFTYCTVRTLSHDKNVFQFPCIHERYCIATVRVQLEGNCVSTLSYRKTCIWLHNLHHFVLHSQSLFCRHTHRPVTSTVQYSTAQFRTEQYAFKHPHYIQRHKFFSTVWTFQTFQT